MSRSLVVLALCLLLLPAGGPSQARAETLTLDQAVTRTLSSNPGLLEASLLVEDAQAELDQAGLASQYNPELSIMSGTRSGDEAPVDLEVELWQELEISGQRRHRRAAARAELASREALMSHRRSLAVGSTRRSFIEALAARDLVLLAGEAVTLSGRLEQTARKRFDAGAITVLERNLSRVRHGESRRAALAARRRAGEATAALKEQLAWPHDEELGIDGDLLDRSAPALELAELRKKLSQRRHDLVALAHAEEAATARAQLARSLSRPNLNVGIGWEREEGDEDLSLGLSLALPLFNRGQANRAMARTGLSRSKVQLATLSRRLRSQLELAWQRHAIAREDHAVFDEDVLSQAEENLDLLQLSFEAGKVSLLQLLPLQQELVELREAHVAALAELAMSRAALEFTAGLTAPSPSKKVSP